MPWRCTAALAPWGTPLQTLAGAHISTLMFSQEKAIWANAATVRFQSPSSEQHSLCVNLAQESKGTELTGPRVWRKIVAHELAFDG